MESSGNGHNRDNGTDKSDVNNDANRRNVVDPTANDFATNGSDTRPCSAEKKRSAPQVIFGLIFYINY
jgi:hypothetical protein